MIFIAIEFAFLNLFFISFDVLNIVKSILCFLIYLFQIFLFLKELSSV